MQIRSFVFNVQCRGVTSAVSLSSYFVILGGEKVQPVEFLRVQMGDTVDKKVNATVS